VVDHVDVAAAEGEAARADKGMAGLEFGLGRFDEDDLAWGNHLDGAHCSSHFWLFDIN